MTPVHHNSMAAVVNHPNRKQILSKRVVKICLSLAALKPGRYVYIVDVDEGGELSFEQAVLKAA